MVLVSVFVANLLNRMGPKGLIELVSRTNPQLAADMTSHLQANGHFSMEYMEQVLQTMGWTEYDALWEALERAGLWPDPEVTVDYVLDGILWSDVGREGYIEIWEGLDFATNTTPASGVVPSLFLVGGLVLVILGSVWYFWSSKGSSMPTPNSVPTPQPTPMPTSALEEASSSASDLMSLLAWFSENQSWLLFLLFLLLLVAYAAWRWYKRRVSKPK